MAHWKRSQIEALGLKIVPDNSGKVRVVDGKTDIDNFKPKYIYQKGVFIPHNVCSSKNSKQLFIRKAKQEGEKDVAGTTNSKAVQNYIRNTKQYYSILASQFRQELIGVSKPYYIEFFFIRKDKSRFDFHNMVQIVCDMMVDAKWIDDDDVNTMVPMPPPKGSPIFLINSNSPGVWIKIL